MTETSTRLSDADKVRVAADYIERVGLHKGDYFEGYQFSIGPGDDIGSKTADAVSRDVKCCTLGALLGQGLTYHGDPENEALSAFYVDVIKPTGANGYGGWNDALGRTADEVVSALRSFADTLDAA